MDVMGDITTRLRELRAADADRRLFGARSHDYRVGGPVDEAELEELERRVGARLPEGYREFLTAVGDGAPGPYYGILPLAEATSRVTGTWGAEALGADSPLDSDVDFRHMLGGPGTWNRHVARLGSDPSYAAGFERLQAEYSGAPWANGRLPVADHGCGDWFFLVLRGPRRGSMWVDSLDSATGLYCLETDFLTWYVRWLDDALERTASGDFGPVHDPHPTLRFGDSTRNPWTSRRR
ncbi:SMI1/KNR4 family protein [Streptomyces sp. NPDC058964]|uniref:SMI1/KNR4 family protein n=1 Tax=Streptomyces sp. NPDC058964 TaxID=3346681 RepID=UPI0036BE92DA